MTAPPRPTPPPPRAPVTYVCLDAGVPVLGRKGCSVHVQEVVRELVRRGHDVDVLAARTGGTPPADLAGVGFRETGRPRGDDAAARERAAVAADAAAATRVRAAASRPGAVVYERYSLWSCEVLEAARDAGATTVLEVNAPLVTEQRRHRVLVDEATAVARTVRAVRAAHLPFAVSGPVARWAQQLAGVPVAVVPNAVDPARFAGPAPRAAVGAGPADVVTLAFVGTFRPWHGVDQLLDALAVLAAEPGPVLRLLLVGDGPLHAAALARATDLGIPVEATGAVDSAQVPALLARADAAVAPYPAGDVYFSPLKVVEYLAAGLPVVAGAVADLPRLFTDGDELLLVPPGDTVALAGALRRLRGDPGLRARLGAAGAGAVRARHTWSAVVDDVLHRASAAAASAGPGGRAPARRGAA